MISHETLDQKVMSYGNLVATEFPPSKWVVDFLVPADGVTIMSALPGSYKTWLLLHLAIGIATGQKVFDEFETTKSKVLMIDEENGARLIQDRLGSLCEYESIDISFLFDAGLLANENSMSQLAAYCVENGITFVTIDSLIRIHNANENDAAEMSKVFRQIKILTSVGISVLITHHNRKPGGGGYGGSQEMRGSSDILAALDCHIAVKRDGRRLKLTQTKLRVCEEMSPIEVELITHSDGRVDFQYIGTAKKSETISRSDKVTNQLLDILSEGNRLNQSQLQKQLRNNGVSVSINTLRILLDDMVKANRFNVEQGERNSLVYSLQQPSTSVHLDISN